MDVLNRITSGTLRSVKDMPLKWTFIVFVFLIGLYCFVFQPKSPASPAEGFALSGEDSKRCPNVLIQKGKEIYLYNSKLAEVPGVNPMKFDNLEEYTEFVKWQRSQGINCPVLFMQNSYDAQGNEIYKIKPSPNSAQEGLPPVSSLAEANMLNVPPGTRPSQVSLLYDASRDDPPYNNDSYPGFDASNQDIGLYTPLDKMFKEGETSGSPSANAMDDNWSGVQE